MLPATDRIRPENGGGPFSRRGSLPLALLAATTRGVARLGSSIAIGGGITTILGGGLSVGAGDLSGGDVRLGVGEAVAYGRLHVALRRRIIALIRPAIALLRHRYECTPIARSHESSEFRCAWRPAANAPSGPLIGERVAFGGARQPGVRRPCRAR